MATSSSYYLNAPSLGSATAIFTDEALSICAADGFYSNGSIVREQVECVLLPQQTCPTCATPCGETINASGGQGIYLLDLDTGSTGGDVGAVIVRFDPYGVPDGIRATLGANVYNKLTSPVDGLHQSSTSGNLTYVGQTSGDCGISGTTYPALIEYSYNGTAFVATGGTQSVTVAPGDVSLGASAPGSCLMVIPKLTASPSVINFEVVGPCSGTAWQMSVDCPVLLTGFSSSVIAVSSVAACALSETATYYNASLANTPGTVGLYDFVYADAYGSTPLNAGYYHATGSITGGNDWFQVNGSGVVIALGVCIAESYNCVDGTCTDPGDGTGTYATLGECEAACFAESYNCVSGTCTDPGDGTGTYATLGECESACVLPVTGLTWTTTVNNPCDATPWVISNQNLTIRYNITDSVNCGGTCSATQSGTATATITVGGLDVNMGLSFVGIGELQAPDFEKITFSLDAVQIADAHAAGGSLGCQMGPVVQTFTSPPPYLLLAGSVHTLFINFTTNDGLFHVGSFYEVELSFVEIP